MAIELIKKIEVAIQTQDKKSVFPLTVRLDRTAEDNKALEAFKAEKEEQHKEKFVVIDEAQKLQKSALRLSEDIEDLNIQISMEKDSEILAELVSSRVKARQALRVKEDRLSTLESETSLVDMAKSEKELYQDVAKKSFELFIVKDDKSEAFVNFIEKNNISYQLAVEEIQFLIAGVKKKK